VKDLNPARVVLKCAVCSIPVSITESLRAVYGDHVGNYAQGIIRRLENIREAPLNRLPNDYRDDITLVSKLIDRAILYTTTPGKAFRYERKTKTNVKKGA